MSYQCKIIADSVSPAGARLTTMEIVFPRFILAEFNTHRDFSRNSASSRAIPTAKLIERVLSDPYVPETWGVNKKGMQAGNEIGLQDAMRCESAWFDARNQAVESTKLFDVLGVHKQWANRLLEPFLWHTVIVSATRWSNFFAQRCHPDAQPEMQRIAYLMKEGYEKSVPVERELHTPYIDDEELGRAVWVLTPREVERKFGSDRFKDIRRFVSVARCARVSYLTHDGKRDIQVDLDLYEKLRTSNHWSPFEHVAFAKTDATARSGNFTGWSQFRKQFAGECR